MKMSKHSQVQSQKQSQKQPELLYGSKGVGFQSLEVINLETCSPELFRERFLLPGIPCIIEDLFHDSPAYAKWTKPYFMKVMGETPVHYHHLDQNYKHNFFQSDYSATTLKDFLVRLENNEPIRHFGMSHPYYDIVSSNAELARDVDFSAIEELLPKDSVLGKGRLDSSLWPFLPPNTPHMFIAGANRDARGHFDPDYSDTFHWCVGTKTG